MVPEGLGDFEAEASLWTVNFDVSSKKYAN